MILISSLLVLTACASPPSQTPSSSAPPSDAAPSATPTPSAPPDALAELAASVQDADGVIAVVGSAQVGDATSGLATITVDDEIDRPALQEILESLVATSDELGIDLDGSHVTVELESVPDSPLVWLGAGLPADLTTELDAWRWLDELDGSARPTALLRITDDRPDNLIATSGPEVGGDGLAGFIAGVTEGGEMAETLAESSIELAIADEVEDMGCSQVIVSGAPVSETSATLLTTIVTDGLDGRQVCVPFTSTADSTHIGATREPGGQLDDALQAQIVEAFEAAGVPIG